MDTNKKTPEGMDEQQSLLVIREMIQVSRKNLRHDGILFIVWGWALFAMSIVGYSERVFILTFTAEDILNILETGLPLLAVAYSVYYVANSRKKVQTYIGISLRYVWVSLFVSMVLVNLIQFNILRNINFELQHPIFMVFMAFAITVTGGILRYRLIVIGGIAFGLFAFLCSYLKLEQQLLAEAFAWIIAFIVPGHILYAHRQK